jgi:hypothetical protein
MTNTEAINLLTTQTTDLLSLFQSQKTNIDTTIANAVETSVDASKIPLIQVTTAMLNTQALVVGLS